MKDLTNLRKIAEEVENSPWAVQESFKNGGARVIDANGFALPGCFNCGENDAVYEEVDATHIATFDPPAILALLNRLEQAEAAVSLIRAMAQDWDANGNACALGDPASSVWHGTAHAIRFTLDRALDGERS